MSIIALYSHAYPAIGESHGASVMAGVAESLGDELSLAVNLLDMVEYAVEDDQLILNFIKETQPDILAIGANYGTYSTLVRLAADLQAALKPDARLVLGGVLATYLADHLLRDVFPRAIVVVGEGEDAFAQIIRASVRHLPVADQIPSIAYASSEGVIHHTPRRLVDIASSPPPYVKHLPRIVERGGQVFTEASRGCAWASCTFCLRGLTDIHGRRNEYRRLPPELIVQRLRELFALGIRAVTFADEDFLGVDVRAAHDLATALAEASSEIPKFDASFTVESVFNPRDSPEHDRMRGETIDLLCRAGLQKGFLGIESCSDTQLRRYAKGHTAEEAARAAERLMQVGTRVEIGVILFDPLCTLQEVRDSLSFMLDNGLAPLASGISARLRLQPGSSFVRILENKELELGTTLFTREIDRNTLGYSYSFLHGDAAEFAESVERWNLVAHPVYYPAKSLSRYGEGGALGDVVDDVRALVSEFRFLTCRAMIDHLERGSVRDHDLLEAGFSNATRQLAQGLLRVLPRDDRVPILARTLAAAREMNIKLAQ